MHLSGKTVIWSIGNALLSRPPRFLVLLDEPLNMQDLIDNNIVTPNHMIPVVVQNETENLISYPAGYTDRIFTLPEFDESIYKYMALTGISKSSQYPYSRFVEHCFVDEFIYMSTDIIIFNYDEYQTQQLINSELLPQQEQQNEEINLSDFFNQGVQNEIEFTFNRNTYYYKKYNNIISLNGGNNKTYNSKELQLTQGEYKIQYVNYKLIMGYFLVKSNGEILSGNTYVMDNYTNMTEEDKNKHYEYENNVIIEDTATIYLSSDNDDIGKFHIYKLSDGYSDLKDSRVNSNVLRRLTALENQSISTPQIYTGNILLGKKWAVLGDSFTAGNFQGETDQYQIISEGPYAGQKCTYQYTIGNRNNMIIQDFSAGGMTIAMPPEAGTFINSITYNERYKQIAADTDYITIYYGINDSHHEDKSTGSDGEDTTGKIPFGAIDDDTIYTFCGAWNVVLEYLIEHYPYAHIGIIITNGADRPEYGLMEIAMAKKWGIPYLDLLTDYQVPLMHRVTASFRPETCSRAFDLRNQAFRVTSTNTHPSAAAHRYQSTFIENFLRRI